MTIKKNPYKSAASQSFYARWSSGKLTGALDSPQKMPSLAAAIHNKFRAHVSAGDFPCLGAKAAFNSNCYRFGFYREMNKPATTRTLAHDLWEYAREQPDFGTDYATFVAAFAEPLVSDEIQWEQQLWAQLQSLHELDTRFFEWNQSVSSNPENAEFSFSFAETAFFVVGLHPISSRLARRFAYPILVFNAHDQFDNLRRKNKFERMKEIVRERDFRLQGSINPNLSDFGEQSEARQYSGRAVEKDWKCPFRALHKKAEDLDV
ncbi:MAG: YqcI/YcgG family protein [Acidobacteriota bacterium]|nr:YqcI/YcgG family protein [Acidobacteriota bacterium]